MSEQDPFAGLVGDAKDENLSLDGDLSPPSQNDVSLSGQGGQASAGKDKFNFATPWNVPVVETQPPCREALGTSPSSQNEQSQFEDFKKNNLDILRPNQRATPIHANSTHNTFNYPPVGAQELECPSQKNNLDIITGKSNDTTTSTSSHVHNPSSSSLQLQSTAVWFDLSSTTGTFLFDQLNVKLNYEQEKAFVKQRKEEGGNAENANGKQPKKTKKEFKFMKDFQGFCEILKWLTVKDLMRCKATSKRIANEVESLFCNSDLFNLEGFWAVVGNPAFEDKILALAQRFHNVNKVRFSWCSNIDKKLMWRILEHLPGLMDNPNKLEGLELFHCYNVDDDFLIELCQKFEMIKKLNVGRCHNLTYKFLDGTSDSLQRVLALNISHLPQLLVDKDQPDLCLKKRTSNVIGILTQDTAFHELNYLDITGTKLNRDDLLEAWQKQWEKRAGKKRSKLPPKGGYGLKGPHVEYIRKKLPKQR